MISKLLNYLNGIAKDRWMHFTAGAVIAALAFVSFGLLLGFGFGLAASVLACIGAGIWKEWWDRGHDGCSDVTDFIVDCLGGALVWVVAVALKWWIL